MSGFMRTAELLAQAGLADKDLAREQMRAQRDAANAQAISSGITGSLSTLVGAGFKAQDIAKQNALDDANTEAQMLAAQHKGDVGTQMNPGATTDKPYYAEGVGDVATNAVNGDKALNPDKPSGFLDSISALLGDKEAAAAKARATAATSIANDVEANRQRATQEARQNTVDTQNAQRFAWEHEDRQGAAAARATAAAKDAQDLADKKAKDAEAIIRPIAADAFRRGQSNDALVGKIIAGMPGAESLTPDQVQTIVIDEHSKQQQLARENAAKDFELANKKDLAPIEKARAIAQTNEANANAAAAGQALTANNPTQKAATDLREEFNRRPEVKDFNASTINFNKMQGAAKSGTAAGDISLIYSFMKMQDPNSTVREGEYATAQNAGAADQKLANLYNQVKDGTRLTDAQRAELLAQAQGFLGAQKTAYDKLARQYGAIAEGRGVPTNAVITGAGAPLPNPWR